MLKRLIDEHKVTHVYTEQMAFNCSKTQLSASYALLGVTHGVAASSEHNVSAAFAAASSKNSFLKPHLPTGTTKPTYAQRKRASVLAARDLITQSADENPWLAVLDRPKADDMSDALLLAIEKFRRHVGTEPAVVMALDVGIRNLGLCIISDRV